MSSTNSGVGFADQAFQGLPNVKLIELYEFTQVNTTSSTAITGTGANTVTVASTAGMAIDQVLAYDSGTAQEYVTVTALTGTTFSAVFAKTHATGVGVSAKVQRQAITIGDPTNIASLAGVVTKSGQAGFALQTQDMVNSGRVPMTLLADNVTLGTANTETLISMTPNQNFTQGSAATNFTVPAGFNFRIQAIHISASNTSSGLGATNAGTTIRMRAAASGAITATTASTLRAVWQTGFIAGSSGVFIPANISGDLELPAGATLAFTRNDTTASIITLAISVIGYLF